jgi:hypothetical protein
MPVLPEFLYIWISVKDEEDGYIPQLSLPSNSSSRRKGRYRSNHHSRWTRKPPPPPFLPTRKGKRGKAKTHINYMTGSAIAPPYQRNAELAQSFELSWLYLYERYLGVSMFFILSSPLSRLPKTFLLEALLGVLSSGLLVGVTNQSEPLLGGPPAFTGVRFSSFRPGKK